MAYADELDAVIAAEQGLRRRIAERIALGGTAPAQVRAQIARHQARLG